MINNQKHIINPILRGNETETVFSGYHFQLPPCFEAVHSSHKIYLQMTNVWHLIKHIYVKDGSTIVMLG